jgi:hypothetical protein
LGLGASYDKNNLKPAPYNLQQHIDIPSTKELVCEGNFPFFYITYITRNTTCTFVGTDWHDLQKNSF